MIRTTYLSNGCRKINQDDGLEYWLDEKDRFHRQDGPAKTFISYDRVNNVHKISTTIEWWFHGKKIDCSYQEEFDKLIKLKAFW